MALWIEYLLACELKGPCSIPNQGTCLGLGPGPQLEAYERQPVDVSLTHQYFSPSLSPFLPLSPKINK